MNTGTNMNYLALRQAIQGRFLVIGQDDSEAMGSNVYRMIDQKPVYHISTSDFNLEDFDEDATKPRLLGKFYHPYLMIGMPDVGGEVKVYVDTRFEGYYVMMAAVKLDTWINGRSHHALDVVCWTPRYPNDTIAKAGERLFRAFLYHMDDVKEGETTSKLYEDILWQEDGWSPSERLIKIFEEVRG
jgi:hypothetical protein